MASKWADEFAGAVPDLARDPGTVEVEAGRLAALEQVASIALAISIQSLRRCSDNYAAISNATLRQLADALAALTSTDAEEDPEGANDGG